MENEGLHQYRFKGNDNPLEKKFAELWEEYNTRSETLGYILSVDNRADYVEDRDRIVAASVIQWLGTPVGQGFLRNMLGLEKTEIN